LYFLNIRLYGFIETVSVRRINDGHKVLIVLARAHATQRGHFASLKGVEWLFSEEKLV
jgi:hypothetical protein